MENSITQTRNLFNVEELLLKLEAIGLRFIEVEKSIGDPDLISDQKAYRNAMREYRRLEPIADHAKIFRGAWDLSLIHI